MARRIADVRLGLRVLEGRDPRDPYSLPVPAANAAPGRARRVTVLDSPPGGATDPRISAAIRQAGDALADAGYEVVDETPPRFTEAIETWASFITQDIRGLAAMVGPLMGEAANRFLNNMFAALPPLDLAGYTAVLMTRQAIMREWAVWMQDVDLVLSPTWTQLPFLHGWDAASPENSQATLEMMRCVTIANVLGLPAACTPAGLVDGLPVGAMITADRFADDLALDAAEAIERVLGLPTPIDPTF